MNCPICKGVSFKEKRSVCIVPSWNNGKELLRYQCQDCDVIFGTLEVLNESKELLKQRYQKLYNSGWRETDSTLAEMDVVKKLCLKPGQVCLNWGGGSVSSSIQKAKEIGVSLDVYEPFDPYARNVITKLDNMGSYDAIISNNLMEHLQDPVAELVLMSNHLKNDGVMIHKTPCWEYVYEWTEYHLFFFVGKSPDVMAKQAGLVIEKLPDNCIKFTKVK